MSEALGIPLYRAGDTVPITLPIDPSLSSNGNQLDLPRDGTWEPWNSHGYDSSAGIAGDANSNAPPKVMGLTLLCVNCVLRPESTRFLFRHGYYLFSDDGAYLLVARDVYLPFLSSLPLMCSSTQYNRSLVKPIRDT